MTSVKFGIFEGLKELLSSEAGRSEIPAAPTAEAASTSRAKPRRRGRLRAALIPDSPGAITSSSSDAALDPARFAGLAGRFIWTDEFVMPRRRCWSEEHALEVARKRVETGWTQAKLADHFGVSRPTIRRALRIAVETQSDAITPDVSPARNDGGTA
jgi:hypothetical protein